MALYKIDNRPARVDFEATEIIARTLQNAKNLLMLRMGEVPYDRLRGFNPALFDLPMPELRAALLPELDRVMLWEPDVEVAEAACWLEDGETVIEAMLEIEAEEWE